MGYVCGPHLPIFRVMAPQAPRIRHDVHGFTLVEMIVVLVVISILMAVAIPSYLSQKSRAEATRAKIEAKNIWDIVSACALENSTSMIRPVDCSDPDLLKSLDASAAQQIGRFNLSNYLNPGASFVYGDDETIVVMRLTKTYPPVVMGIGMTSNPQSGPARLLATAVPGLDIKKDTVYRVCLIHLAAPTVDDRSTLNRICPTQRW